MIILAVALLSCTVTDGDTIRCGKERVRLIGIDAPEMHGCPRHRKCAPGNGRESKAALIAAINGRKIRLERFGQDRYGRTLAIAWAGRVNLACHQLRSKQAIYKPQWDVNGRVKKACISR